MNRHSNSHVMRFFGFSFIHFLRISQNIQRDMCPLSLWECPSRLCWIILLCLRTSMSVSDAAWLMQFLIQKLRHLNRIGIVSGWWRSFFVPPSPLPPWRLDSSSCHCSHASMMLAWLSQWRGCWPWRWNRAPIWTKAMSTPGRSISNCRWLVLRCCCANWSNSPVPQWQGSQVKSRRSLGKSTLSRCSRRRLRATRECRQSPTQRWGS